MADNRTLAKGVQINGAPVYFQEESTTDTTMPSTSFFKTEDVDGKPVIISRDNIMGIVKDCLGSILNGLTDQTTVTKVPTLNGNTLGASAVSTLASVLGVTMVTYPWNSSWVRISTTSLDSGFYTFQFGSMVSDGPTDIVEDRPFVLFRLKYTSNRHTSIIISASGIWYRPIDNDGWTKVA